MFRPSMPQLLRVQYRHQSFPAQRSARSIGTLIMEQPSPPSHMPRGTCGNISVSIWVKLRGHHHWLQEAAFYIMAEKWMIDSPGVFDSSGILGYWRFKDDILVVLRSECIVNLMLTINMVCIPLYTSCLKRTQRIWRIMLWAVYPFKIYQNILLVPMNIPSDISRSP